MTQKKQTAIGWLVEQLEKHYVKTDLKNTVAYYQAKKMEKEQIMDAYDNGEFNDGMNETAEQYYTETYNND